MEVLLTSSQAIYYLNEHPAQQCYNRLPTIHREVTPAPRQPVSWWNLCSQ